MTEPKVLLLKALDRADLDISGALFSLHVVKVLSSRMPDREFDTNLLVEISELLESLEALQLRFELAKANAKVRKSGDT